LPLNPVGGHLGEGDGIGLAVFFATTFTSEALADGSEEKMRANVTIEIEMTFENMCAILP
jgi:hypothetical protein